ncbi:MAG: hypothetical protein HY552_01525 [Elusimicrobia bacterium]|nr:hypothetical protein [Elusimicrobiota bacterium]
MDAPVAALDELRRRVDLPENEDALFILLMNYEARFQPLYRLLSRRRRALAIFEWGHMPIRPPNKLVKLLRLVRDPRALATAMGAKVTTTVSRQLRLVKPFDLVFAAGEAAVRTHPNAKRIVPINLCDYDLFQAAAAGPRRLIPGRYGVFLDSNHAMNPDRAFIGLAPIDPPRYFGALNRFFGLLEKKLGVSVAVALHPKSSYGPEAFEGRAALKDATAALVRDAEFVLCHLSTSMSCAVLARKPILYVYTDEMARAMPECVDAMRDLSDYLGMATIALDHVRSPDEIVLPPVSPERYDAFKYGFLTSRESERATTRDIVLRELRRLGCCPKI